LLAFFLLTLQKELFLVFCLAFHLSHSSYCKSLMF
jgi:hypothetical protein